MLHYNLVQSVIFPFLCAFLSSCFLCSLMWTLGLDIGADIAQIFSSWTKKYMLCCPLPLLLHKTRKIFVNLNEVIATLVTIHKWKMNLPLFLSAVLHMNVLLIFVDNTILCCGTTLLSRSISGKQLWRGFRCETLGLLWAPLRSKKVRGLPNKQRGNWFFHQIRTRKLNFASLI